MLVMAESRGVSTSVASPKWMRASWLDVALPIFLVVLALLIWGPLISVGLNLGDEGWLLTAIDRLVGGERLYADIYRSYAPGLYWSFAAMFRWLDADLVTIRWVWLTGLALLSVGVYRLARSVTPVWAAFAAALVPILLRAPVHKTFVPLCYLASLWLCRRIVERYGSVPAMLAIGMGFGLVGLFRQEAAAFGLLIGLMSLILMPSRPDGVSRSFSTILRAGCPLAAGVALVWLPVITILWIDESLAPAIEQLVVTGARGNAAMDLPFPDIQRVVAGPDRLWASIFYLPGIAAVLGATLTWRAWQKSPGSTEAIVLGQWTAMAFLAHSIFASRTDLAHLLQALIAPILILAYAVGVAWRAGALRSHWSARFGAIALGVWVLAAGVALNDLPRQYSLRRDGAALVVAGSEMMISSSEATTLRRLVAAIQASTGSTEPIFVVPYSPGIYHLAGRSNPTRHGAVLPGYASDVIQSEIISALERSGTRLLVVERIAYDGRPDRALSAYAPELAAHITRHFVPVDRIGRFTLMQRR